jgi:hypothetical protein
MILPTWAEGRLGSARPGLSPSGRSYTAYAGSGSVIPGEITVHLEDGRTVTFRRLSTVERIWSDELPPEPIRDSVRQLTSGRPSQAPKTAPGPSST